jgi:hypothetical protein
MYIRYSRSSTKSRTGKGKGKGAAPSRLRQNKSLRTRIQQLLMLAYSGHALEAAAGCQGRPCPRLQLEAAGERLDFDFVSPSQPSTAFLRPVGPLSNTSVQSTTHTSHLFWAIARTFISSKLPHTCSTRGSAYPLLLN